MTKEPLRTIQTAGQTRYVSILRADPGPKTVQTGLQFLNEIGEGAAHGLVRCGPGLDSLRLYHDGTGWLAVAEYTEVMPG